MKVDGRRSVPAVREIVIRREIGPVNLDAAMDGHEKMVSGERELLLRGEETVRMVYSSVVRRSGREEISLDGVLSLELEAVAPGREERGAPALRAAGSRDFQARLVIERRPRGGRIRTGAKSGQQGKESKR